MSTLADGDGGTAAAVVARAGAVGAATAGAEAAGAEAAGGVMDAAGSGVLRDGPCFAAPAAERWQVHNAVARSKITAARIIDPT